MGTVKSVKKLIFNSNFSFYFKILAINGTEKRECVHNLSLSYWEDVHNLLLRYGEDVHNLSLKKRECPQLVTENMRLQNKLKQDSSNAAVGMNQVSNYLATKS